MTGSGESPINNIFFLSRVDLRKKLWNQKQDCTFLEYTDNFEIKYDPNGKKFILNITKPLDNNIFKEKTQLVLLMEAKGTHFKTGTSVLVIEIEKNTKTEPKFKKALYRTNYPKSGEGKIELNDIDFENIADTNKLSIKIDSKFTYHNITQTTLFTHFQ